MSSKILSFNFFSVNIDGAPNIGAEFGALLDTISKKTHDSRKGNVGTRIYRFRELRKNPSSHQWEGIISYVRMDKDPDKEDIDTGEHEIIELEANQGLAELQVFLYDEQLNVLILQSKQLAITESKFPELVKSAANSALAIDLFPILTKNAYESAFSGSNITKFIAKVTKPINPGNYGKIESISQIIGYMDSIGGMDVEVAVKAPPKEKLTARVIKPFVDYFLKHRDATSKLQVKVDGRKEAVNLLMDCIRAKISVTIGDDRREVSVTELYGAVRDAWTLQEDAIKEVNSRTL